MKDYKWINTRKYFFRIKDLIATYLYLNGQKHVVNSFLVDEEKKTVEIEISEKYNTKYLGTVYIATNREEIDGILRSVTYLYDNRIDPGD